MYYRVHWEDCPPFCAENASSAPWADPDMYCDDCLGSGSVEGDPCPTCNGTGLNPNYERTPGYSCCEYPDDLIEYFEARGGCPDEVPVVIFAGQRVGYGIDGEPLVIPYEHPRPRWLTYGQLKAIVRKRRREGRI